MPVIEHPVHEHGVRDAEHRYGCHNRAPFREWCESSSLMDASHWPFRMSRECRYDRSLDDSACAGCRHAGSGERYVAEQQAKGAA
jgi:hypothetical protein